ncbi:MAG: YdbL family protein [Candidatus Brocadiales bacterium]
MSKFRLLNILLSLVVAMVVFSSLTQAKDIKSRMKERIPTIKALKAKGIVGENNKGYLEFLGNKISNKDVVDAQNEDRKKVYSAIAKQQGTTVAVVGKRRAQKKRNKAKSGAWIQKENGKWHQKK